MNNYYYILNDKQTVPVDDIFEWAKWFEKADRRVAFTTLDIGEEVSTVFIGINHQWGNGPVLLFETLVFGGDFDGEMERYSTWDEAAAGHKKMVARVMAGDTL